MSAGPRLSCFGAQATADASNAGCGTLSEDGRTINVPAKWQAKTGSWLLDDVRLGKVLGEGMQGKIFELLDGEGHVSAVVLKAAKPAALISNMEREWDVGQKVTSLQNEQGHLPGFMKVGPALRTPDSKMRGQILERLNGDSCSKIFGRKDFADAQYIRQMLLEVFTALSLAQRKFGFHHYDLRCDNVFEHMPSRDQSSTDKLSVLVSGHPDSRDYRRQFKVIDYGLTKLDDHYSWASGWVETQLAELRVSGTSISASAGELSSMADSEVVAAAGSPSQSQRLKDRQARKLKAKWNQPTGFEWVHKQAWRAKGDVYHLLFDLSWFIYGTCWPREDSVLVYLLFALIQHTTGIQPQAWFKAPPTEDTTAAEEQVAEAVTGNVPALDPTDMPHRREIGEKAEGGCLACWHLYLRYSRLRRWGRKLKAFYLPSNSGLRASEALQSAFFLHGLEEI